MYSSNVTVEVRVEDRNDNSPRFVEPFYEVTVKEEQPSGTPILQVFLFKGPVKRATFFLNLSRNIVALHVETHCCAYYHVCDQLVSQQNTVLQVEAICCAK